MNHRSLREATACWKGDATNQKILSKGRPGVTTIDGDTAAVIRNDIAQVDRVAFYAGIVGKAASKLTITRSNNS